MNATAMINPNDVTGLISPAGEAYLLQVKEITSKDYIDTTHIVNPPMAFKWAGITWMVHTGLPGNATSSERLFVFHRDAIGLARDTESMNVSADHNDEEDYYYARASMFMGSKLLQNTGVCSIRHDGSGFAATA